MWRITLRDLQFRRRRFAIATAAVALVFAINLLLVGIDASFRNEVVRTVRMMDADHWVVPAGVAGPFTASTPLSAADVASVVSAPGVERADPVVLLHYATSEQPPRDLNIIGFTEGGMGSPQVVAGRKPTRRWEAVVDRSLGAGLGDRVPVGHQQVKIVGLVEKVTYFAGTPAVFLRIQDARTLAFAGAPLTTAVLVEGDRPLLPRNLLAMGDTDVEADLRRPLAKASETVSMLAVLLRIVAAAIVGSIVYLSAMERTRDFAVLKATGAASRQLFVSVVVQALILTGLAAVVSVVVQALIAPSVPLVVEVPPAAFLELALVAGVVSALGSLAGLRRAVGADPVLAFSPG